MQNRYVGDFGDFVKLGVLRTLASGQRLGVAWWLYPDENHNQDGKHTAYLDQAGKWRHLDPHLFDALGLIRQSGRRHISLLEEAALLPGALFANEPLQVDGTPNELSAARQLWFSKVKQRLADADIVFADPDNGIESETFSIRKKKAGKSVCYNELQSLGESGRNLIVYHHQTRRKGGHIEEISYLSGRLASCGFASVAALRAKSYSPRVFFILNGSPELWERAKRLTQVWKETLSWHPFK